MLLYEVPPRTRIRVLSSETPPPGGWSASVGSEYNFRNIDGMYSYCTDDDGKVFHLKAWTEVEIVSPKN